MKTIDGFKDMKPPCDFASSDWLEDIYLTEPDADGRLWFLVVGALQMLIGIGIGYWIGRA